MKLRPRRNGTRGFLMVLSIILASLSFSANAIQVTSTLISETSFPGNSPQQIQVKNEGTLTIEFHNSNDQANRFEMDESNSYFKDFPNGLLFTDSDHQTPVTPRTVASGIYASITYPNLATGTYYMYSPYTLKNVTVKLNYEDPDAQPMPSVFSTGYTGTNSGYYLGTIKDVTFYWQGDVSSGNGHVGRQLQLNVNEEDYKGIKLNKEGVNVTATPEIVDGNKLKITFTPEVSPLNFKQIFAQTGSDPFTLFIPAGIVNVDVNGEWRPSQDINTTLYLDPEKTEVFLSDETNENPFSVVPDIWGAEGAFSYFNCKKDGLYLFYINTVPNNIIGAPMAFYCQDETGKWVKVNYSLYCYWWTGHNFVGYIALKAGTTYNIYGQSGYDDKPYHNNYAQYCTLSYLSEDINAYPVAKIVEGTVFDGPLKNLSLKFGEGETFYDFRKTPSVTLTRNGVNVTDVTVSAAIEENNKTILVTFEGEGLKTSGNYSLKLTNVEPLYQKNHQFINPNMTVSFTLNGEEPDEEPQVIKGTFSPESNMIFSNDEEIIVNVTFGDQPIGIANENVSPATLNDTPLSWGTEVSIQGNAIRFNLGIQSEEGNYILTLNEGAVKIGDNGINAEMTWACTVEESSTDIPEPQEITGVFTPATNANFYNNETITVNASFDGLEINVIDEFISPASLNGTPLSWGTEVTLAKNAIQFNLGVLAQAGTYTLTLNKGAVLVGENDINAAMTWNCTVVENSTETPEPQEPEEAIGEFNPQSGVTFKTNEEVEVTVSFDNEILTIVDRIGSPASLDNTQLAWGNQVNLNETATAIEINLGSFNETGSYTLTLNKGAVSMEENTVNAQMIWSFIVEKASTGISLILPDSDNLYRVYTLNGVNVLTTENASDVLALPKGIYLVNGVKFVVK